MKVLLTATVQSHISQFHKPLVDVLHAHGYEVHAAARNNLAEKNGLKLDFVDRVYDVPFARSPASPDNLRAYKELRKILAQEHYDIIHCNTPMGGVVTRLAAKKMRRMGSKVFYTAHGFHFYRGAPIKNWLFYYPIEKMLSRITDQLITITAEDYALAMRAFCCPTARIHGVGVDERRYFPVDEKEKRRLRAEMGFAPEQKILLNIGELRPNKNQRMAIRMMKRVAEKYPDAVLLMAGNGPEQESLTGYIAACGMEKNVQMIGYRTNLQDYQHMADVLVSCSYREGLPLNIVEAMLSGNPVVAADNRGHRELIRDGENGFIVSPDNDISMAEKVLALLGDEELASGISAAARVSAQSYGFCNVKRELEGIYFPGG